MNHKWILWQDWKANYYDNEQTHWLQHQYASLPYIILLKLKGHPPPCSLVCENNVFKQFRMMAWHKCEFNLTLSLYIHCWFPPCWWHDNIMTGPPLATSKHASSWRSSFRDVSAQIWEKLVRTVKHTGGGRKLINKVSTHTLTSLRSYLSAN